MENESNTTTTAALPPEMPLLPYKNLLIIIAIGIWVIALQNTGLIPTSQRVNVTNEVETQINGRVNASVSGDVSVNNMLDVNLRAINGHRDAFYGSRSDEGYFRIPVYTGN